MGQCIMPHTAHTSPCTRVTYILTCFVWKSVCSTDGTVCFAYILLDGIAPWSLPSLWFAVLELLTEKSRIMPEYERSICLCVSRVGHCNVTITIWGTLPQAMYNLQTMQKPMYSGRFPFDNLVWVRHKAAVRYVQSNRELLSGTPQHPMVAQQRLSDVL